MKTIRLTIAERKGCLVDGTVGIIEALPLVVQFGFHFGLAPI